MKTGASQGKHPVMQAKVTGRHAITLPAALCRELNINVGDTVEIEVSGRQAILRPKDDQRVESVRGILRDLFPTWESVESFIEDERSPWSEHPEDRSSAR